MANMGVRLIAASIVLASLGGCSNKDRETIQKTGNGTESFHFEAKAVADASKPAATSTSVTRSGTQGSSVDSFRFDPKAVPRAGHPGVAGTKEGK